MQDAGARDALIFTDLGVVTTTRSNGPALTRTMLTELAANKPDVIVFELGDGLLGTYGVDSILECPDIRSVHVKDARRPTIPGHWGEEVPLGQGEVDIHRFVRTLKAIGYTGPLVIEREGGDQAGRINDVKTGLDFLKKCLTEPVEADDAVPRVHNSEQPRI